MHNDGVKIRMLLSVRTEDKARSEFVLLVGVRDAVSKLRHGLIVLAKPLGHGPGSFRRKTRWYSPFRVNVFQSWSLILIYRVRQQKPDAN